MFCQNEKLKFREIVPGSIFGAIGMLVVTIIYSIYAENLANYNIIYGSLASFLSHCCFGFIFFRGCYASVFCSIRYGKIRRKKVF